MLDIEKDPIAQGFDAHGYDLVIASNVLHATRYLEETLANCRALLAPAGQLVALENLRGLGWMDLTFGQLDGWWRFADAYRPHHALASPAVWSQALSDAGFEGVEVLGVDESFSYEMLDKGIIVAQGPAQVTESPGVWVLTADDGGVAEELAAELLARNQTVVLAGRDVPEGGGPSAVGVAVINAAVDPESREAWQSLIEGLPEDVPLKGVVHLQALHGHGGTGSHHRDGGGRKPRWSKRAGAGAGCVRFRCDTGAGRVVCHARGAGIGARACGGACRRDPVGYGQGSGPGSGPAAAAND